MENKHYLKDEVEIEEIDNRLICPVCSGTVWRGFSTHLGKVYVCNKYPKNCNFISRREAIIETHD
ncbi:MAG: hypothetical protein GTO02_16005 [Candidatus Dadabacteria bacterium]|nr:hypothetical protein [Candidatus Dadabacteria bacterium]NIQ15837.1 hypothetical protein [Candidatus Dadabacteria bacterium]